MRELMEKQAAPISHLENIVWRVCSLILLVAGASIGFVAINAGLRHLDDPITYFIVLAFIGWMIAVGRLLRLSFAPTFGEDPEFIGTEVRNGSIRL
jgi:hypothetical protein